MRYSARQQECLEAMGIVPWVPRYVAEVVAVAEVAEVAAVAFTPAAGGAMQPPGSADSLGEWILSRALVPIHYRGSEFPVLGAAEATVLVIVEQTETQPATAALEGDAARLFQLMLRSIQLTARDTRQCLLSRESAVGPELSVASSACTLQTRVVLILMNPWPFDVADIAVEQHVGRLPGSELPVWRIAHPQLLLEQPLLKRQSWQVLKSLQSVLTGSSAL